MHQSHYIMSITIKSYQLIFSLCIPLCLGLFSLPASAATNYKTSVEQVEGFAILGGLTTINGEMDQFINAFGGNSRLVNLSGSYTLKNGFGFGATVSSWDKLRTPMGNGNFGNFNGYLSFTFPYSLKLMAGVGGVYLENKKTDHIENDSGLMLGVGYTFPCGFSMEVHNSNNSILGIKGSQTSLLFGYKW